MNTTWEEIHYRNSHFPYKPTRSIQFVFDRPIWYLSLSPKSHFFSSFLFKKSNPFPDIVRPFWNSVPSLRLSLAPLPRLERIPRKKNRKKREPNERKVTLRCTNSWRVWWWSIYWCTSNDVGRLIRANTWPPVSTYQLLTITFVLFICEKMDWLRHA